MRSTSSRMAGVTCLSRWCIAITAMRWIGEHVPNIFTGAVRHLRRRCRREPELAAEKDEVPMAITCPVDFDTARLRDEIRSVYSRVATAPEGEFHFHRGAAYAEGHLAYDPRQLAELPPSAVESFAGVGNPLRIEPIPAGATVVDVGCGAGMDLMLAARAVGPRGRAIGVDMTDGMLRKAEAGAAGAGLANVELRRGDALELPLEGASADVVVSNGVLNLAPDKRRAFSEVLRVLRPGGRFLYADIAVAAELPESIRRDIDLWSG